MVFRNESLFHMIQDKEFTPEDQTFLIKIMMLDPRDRPTAKQLLEASSFWEPWILVVHLSLLQWRVDV
jgi:hypothetical protein